MSTRQKTGTKSGSAAVARKSGSSSKGAAAKTPASGKPAAKTSAKAAAGPKVLVVDDYQDAREMCVEFLIHCGYRATEAKDGQEAVEKALAEQPDVILMDLSLPGVDGWEATRRIKKDERTKHIPVIALTGHALAGHSEGAKDAGCDSFLTKPCLPDQMVAEVKRMLDLQNAKK
jgi:CheY-like chemotaxis protein